MRTTSSLSAVAAAIALVACGGGGTDTDTDGGGTPFVPQVTGISIDKTTIDVGANEKATVTISLVAGASANLASYSMQRQGAGGSRYFEEDSFAPVSNSFQLDTNAYFPSGTWSLSPIWVTTATNRYKLSQAGADTTYTLESFDLAGNPITVVSNASTIPVRSLSLTNNLPDTTPPAFTSVTVSGTGTGTLGAFRPGDTVTIDITVADTESGLVASWLYAHVRPKSAHSALAYPYQSTLPGTFSLVSGSTYRSQIVLEPSLDLYPVDLYVAVDATDVAFNHVNLMYDSSQSDTAYFDSYNYALSAVNIATVNFQATWPPTTVANGSTPLTPGTSGSPGPNTFSIASDATVVHSYTVASGTPYNFSLATSGGSAQAVVGLYYADGSVVTNGTLAGTRDRIVGTSVTGVTPTQSGTLYVVTRCNSGEGCTGGSVTHYLATP